MNKAKNVPNDDKIDEQGPAEPDENCPSSIREQTKSPPQQPTTKTTGAINVTYVKETINMSTDKSNENTQSTITLDTSDTQENSGVQQSMDKKTQDTKVVNASPNPTKTLPSTQQTGAV